MSFDEFSEMVERMAVTAWRSAVGRDNEEAIASVSTVIFTREDAGKEWEFSFGLRAGGRWHQAYSSCAPVEYDPCDPPDGYDPELSPSPQNRASAMAMDMLERVAGELVG